MMNILLNYIYSYSLEGATKMKQLACCFLTGRFIQPLWFTYFVFIFKFAKNKWIFWFYLL